MTEFAIVIAQQSVHLYRLSGASAEPVARAGAEDDPIAWVAAHMPARGNCSLVSDIMDEAYIRNVLPPIWLAGTRQQLLQRRLQQQMRDNPYRAAVLVPSGSWRPPTRVSLIGMGQSERIAQWLAALTAHHIRVKGLWPLSALIALEVKQKLPRRPRTDPLVQGPPAPPESADLRPILALVATPAGLRQVLVRGKTPLFSRLALSVGEGSLSADFVLAEARRTVQYLISQEWLGSADQPVATQMWLPLDDEQALADVGSDPALDVQFIEGIADAYARLLPRLKSASAQLQFLPDESRTQWRAAQIAAGAKYGSMAILAVAVLWSADLLWLSWGKRNLAQEQLARAAVINQQASQEVLRAKGDLSLAGLAVASVQAWQTSINAQPDQTAAFQHLGLALQATPGLTLEKIRWELAVLPALAPAAVSAPADILACPKPPGATGNDPAAPAPPVPDGAQVPKPVLAMLRLTASLLEDISQRQALQLQERMLAQLGNAGWTASMVSSTVNFDPSQAQGGTVGRPGARTMEICIQRTAP